MHFFTGAQPIFTRLGHYKATGFWHTQALNQIHMWGSALLLEETKRKPNYVTSY